MNSLYEWIRFLHMVAAISFMVSHGTSIAISFRLKKEEDVERIKTMLDISGSMWIAMILSLLVAGIAGIVLGFMLSWWSQWWIWVSIVLLVVITIWMFQVGQSTYHQLRKTLGMPYQAGGKEMPAQEPAPIEESYALIARTRPGLMLLGGYGGFVVVIWLMMFKPF
ncbi:MAG TPA: hypothetical protein VMW34_08425 [Anaerolineales bacterium]|nr:hypothetical protein [Anaerolineales bacterium]